MMPEGSIFEKIRRSGGRQTLRQRGAALVVVLSVLVLLSILLMAFFSAVETDSHSSSANRQLISLRQLSDLPLQIVQTQIRAATTAGQEGSLEQSTNTWTSQPGLLRLFNNTGELVRAYKLYSSSTLDEESMDFLPTEISPDWVGEPNRWVNLNAPFRPVLQPEGVVYPILNPAATDWASGLAIEADPGGLEDASMPVEWLYVLEDGRVVAFDDLTPASPPVGRIAFWTDDETCKININTAGERTMWDRPRAWHEKREIYGRNQPSTGEYNAYPGHPATVSLSAALGRALDGETQNSIAEAMLSLTPRYRWGGSENATRTIWDRDADWRAGSPTNTNKKDRLYATSSEFLVDVTRELQDARLIESVKHSGFLLTESSRAPELNLFGMPRVGIWPIDVSAARRTVYDQLIARCLTIGGTPYFFQRSNPLANNEADAIPRNRELLDYLDRLTQRPINGFGDSFQAKWGTEERRQILTQIFDFIRGATNLSDTSRNPEDYHKQFTPAFNMRRGFVVPTKIPDWETQGLGRAPVMTHAAVVFYAYGQENLEPDPANPPDLRTDVHALLWFNFFDPMQGMAPTSTVYRIRVNGNPFGLASAGSPGPFADLAWKGNESDQFWFPRTNQLVDWGGYHGMLIQAGSATTGFADYAFHSVNPVEISGDLMNMRGGVLEIELIENHTGVVLQKYTLEFPNADDLPVPSLWGGFLNGTGMAATSNPNFYAGMNPLHFSERRFDRPLDMGDQAAPSDPPGGPPRRLRSNLIFGRRNETKRPVDVTRTMELRDGDARLIAGLDEVPANYFVPGEGYFTPGTYLTGSLASSPAQIYPNDRSAITAQYGKHVDVNFVPAAGEHRGIVLPKRFDGQEITSLRGMGWAGDFDNGYLGERDGPYANKPDEGHTLEQKTGGTTDLPYFARADNSVGDGQRVNSWDPRVNGFFSPTRQVPSAIAFGSLPVGVKRTASSSGPEEIRPWETLLFSPVSQAAMVADGDGNFGHPGSEPPPDFLLLDLFNMPVVEPYAVSEPFSTAGKINLNQRLIPFSHITRETGLHAALKNLEFTAIPHVQVPGSTNTNPAQSYRSGAAVVTNTIQRVDVERTLEEIARVLDPNGNTGAGAFRSATEICRIPLIPQGLGAQTIQQFWQNRQLTGDNTRETPYHYLYPLLTTQSNTYQIHYRVQTLQALRTKANFNPAEDFLVTGEQRGSYVLERYLDANDPQFAGGMTDRTPLGPFYQFRVLRHNRLTPNF